MAHEDPTKVDAQHYTVEHEDEQVRALRARYGPHEKSVMHSHPALVGVALTDAQVRFADSRCFPARPPMMRRALRRSSGADPTNTRNHVAGSG